VRRWGRPIAAVAVALVVFLQAEAKLASAGRDLTARIGPVMPTATLLRDLPEGSSLVSASVGFPEVPVRWRPPDSIADEAGLDGMVAAVALKAGAILGPGTIRKEDSTVGAALRSGERIITAVALAPISAIQPGSQVEVLISVPGKPVEIASKRAIVVSIKPLGSSADGSDAGKVRAELRAGERLSLRLAAAEVSEAEVRLVPLASGS
jgi:hypothetical protein